MDWSIIFNRSQWIIYKNTVIKLKLRHECFHRMNIYLLNDGTLEIFPFSDFCSYETTVFWNCGCNYNINKIKSELIPFLKASGISYLINDIYEFSSDASKIFSSIESSGHCLDDFLNRHTFLSST